ncbi:MAG TPA: L-threonylcarbamoyladenylate synthase [Vicinamibacterales bacterium]|nr:L-threonylcarbamoyladenylate synthase [Vicinamibacterales bacterium]
MLRLRVDPDRPADDELMPAVRAIQRGGIVAFPTDTFYGLAVDPRSSAAVRKIFEVKHRPADQPIPLIAESLSQVAARVGTLTPLAERLASKYWPGPLTLIIVASSELCAEVTRGTGTAAVRVPDHRVARALAGAVGHAMTSTSANLSGFAPLSSPDEVAASLGDAIDVLVDAGSAPGGMASTIINATGTDPILVRAGAVPWERVLKFLG